MNTPPDSPRWWRNRRRMAWLAIIAGVSFPFAVVLAESESLVAVAGPFYLFVGMVVGAYIGAATYDDTHQGGR